MDRLTKVTDPLSQDTQYFYDAVGNRTKVTNVRAKDWQYAYDALNRPISVKDPFVPPRETTYEYDAGGNLTKRTDARSLVTKYVYDANDRLTKVEHWDATETTLLDDVTYGYDDAGNRTSMIDPTGTTSYGYDVLNRLTSVTFPGMPAPVVSYDYDAVGNRIKITYPDTNDVDYVYDDANQLDTATDWLTNVTDYDYDAAGSLTLVTYPNGVTATYAYDDADRLLSVTNAKGATPISSFTYTLDAVGNRTQRVDDEGTHTYVLDDLSPADPGHMPRFCQIGGRAGVVSGSR